MTTEAVIIPTLDDPTRVVRLSVIYPDVWPEPPRGTEMLAAVYYKSYFLLRRLSFWARDHRFGVVYASSLGGVRELQAAVDEVARMYRETESARSLARGF